MLFLCYIKCSSRYKCSPFISVIITETVLDVLNVNDFTICLKLHNKKARERRYLEKLGYFPCSTFVNQTV